jgi:DNA-directed RNA polymerase subunit beta'
MAEPLSDLRALTDFKSLLIKLASPDEIRSWSRGEVTKPETINYRTLKPEKDGLFDERIFGPTKDWECYCGKYKRVRYKGVVCDKCGVEVTQSRVRRERMGHINLASPVVHVWFFKGAPSKISLILGVPPRGIEQVIYFARYLVIDVKDAGRQKAIKNLREAKNQRLTEMAEIYKERKERVEIQAEEAKDKVKKKIKNKEQLVLAVSEIDLESRKKRKVIEAEERDNIERTEELFNSLRLLVKNLKPLSILSEEEYDELVNYGAAEFFEAKMGAEAILAAIEKINLEELAASLRKELEEIKTGSARYTRLSRRLKLVDGLRRAKINPSWMVLKVLPVLPPDLRPMVQLSGGRFATSDLNDLYRRVINRNNRLKHLISLGAPEIILRNEKRMLQESVDSLIDASQRKATRRGRGRQPLRSLSDMLKGKQGRFRQNLLGKRVDYSGRSVIIVGPELKLNQCGLPKDMALEMFKPFVLREMISRGIAPNVKSAKNMLERRPPEVFDILEEITRNHPVLLNRAPTLHKLSIQAFYPVLIEGAAIRIHPAICSGFNADFDGDQMAVHVPLSKKAIKEAEELMLPENNLLRPADGSPISTPASKEMALGVYYLTSIDPRLEPIETIYTDKEEAIMAWQVGKVELRQRITVRIENKLIETTTGRILFNEALPSGFGFINESITSGVIKEELFTKAYAAYDRKEVVRMIDAIKDLGFYGGTISGLSFGIFDAKTYPHKEKIITQADKRITEIEKNFAQGLITEEEKRRLAQEVWIEVTEDLADKTWDQLDSTNSIRLVIDAKVGRTSRDQVKQLAAMRGLVVDPLGKIVELPIKSNFREGLSVFEYVTSSRGSRKGLTDTALKTADAGYLTRRLVDVAHDVLVRSEDCGTDESIEIKKESRPKSFVKRIRGRVAAEDITLPGSKKVLVRKGEVIDEESAAAIEKTKVEKVNVYSPLSCSERYGICVKCYGWDLSNRKMVKMGTPVGVIAAQSIGEPGTQLTLKTKHSAGIVGLDVTQGLPRVEELFEARTPKILSPLAEISGKVRIGETKEGYKVTITSVAIKPKEEREYIIPKTIKLAVEDGQLVDVGTQLASGALDIKEILSIRGLRQAQDYLVNEVQAVYESQGIPIDDKHFEVVVRKMSDEVRIVTSGDTPLLPGELIEKARFEEENEKVLAAGGEPASAQQVILGITRRSLYTESWLSAASFEQTIDVLTEASLLGKEDKLLGLKENVIIGRLIPATLDKGNLSPDKVSG